MHALLTVLVAWLSINFGLPANYDHPRVEKVTPARMAAVRYRGLASDWSPGVAVEAGRPESAQKVYALYDDSRRVIYLPEVWTGTTPAGAVVARVVVRAQT